MRACFLAAALRCATWQSRLDGFGHTPEVLDFPDQCPCLCQFHGQVFHIVRTGPRIDTFGDVCFLLEIYLAVWRSHAGGKISRQCNGLIQRIGVKALRVVQSGLPWLRCSTRHIVERILLMRLHPDVDNGCGAPGNLDSSG